MRNYHRQNDIDALSGALLSSLKGYVLSQQPQANKKHPLKLKKFERVTIHNQPALSSMITSLISENSDINSAVLTAHSENDIIRGVLSEFERLSTSGNYTETTSLRIQESEVHRQKLLLESAGWNGTRKGDKKMEYPQDTKEQRVFRKIDFGQQTGHYGEGEYDVYQHYGYQLEKTSTETNQTGYGIHSLINEQDHAAYNLASSASREHVSSIESVSFSERMLKQAIVNYSKRAQATVKAKPVEVNTSAAEDTQTPVVKAKLVDQQTPQAKAEVVKQFFAVYRPGTSSYWEKHGKNASNTSYEELLSHARGENRQGLFFGYSGSSTRATLERAFSEVQLATPTVQLGK